jgi:hypothetical protein
MNKLIYFFNVPNYGSLNKEYIVFYEKAIVFYIYHTFKILNDWLAAAYFAESGFEPPSFESLIKCYNLFTSNGNSNKVPMSPSDG